jgi:hypothetical protein
MLQRHERSHTKTLSFAKLGRLGGSKSFLTLIESSLGRLKSMSDFRQLSTFLNFKWIISSFFPCKENQTTQCFCRNIRCSSHQDDFLYQRIVHSERFQVHWNLSSERVWTNIHWIRIWFIMSSVIKLFWENYLKKV